MDIANLAKELLTSRGFGVLATHSTRVPNYPFASIVNYSVDESGAPVFLMSQLALHTTNLSANPKASLLVFAEAAESDPLSSARVNYFGTIHTVPDSDLTAIRARYLARHPESEQWIDFGDFALYRMTIVDGYYVGGFGVMGWVGAM